MINFLTNAIRYSLEQSKVKITIKQEDKAVSVSVIDDGKGIDDRYKNRIFDSYFQIPASSKTGTGLGLAISREFIEAQGGEIDLVSEMAMGSTSILNCRYTNDLILLNYRVDRTTAGIFNS